MAKSKLDLTIKPHKVLPENCGTIMVKGEGNKDYQFPDDLVGRVLRKSRKPRVPLIPPSIVIPGAEKFLLPKVGGLWDFIKPAVPKVDDSNFQGLINGADVIQRRIIARQSDALMEKFFGDMQETALLAAKQMDAKYQGAIAAHQRQVKNLRQQVEKAWPQLVKELAQRNPGVPLPVLMQHALQMLAQELSPIIGVLSIYTDAFRQRLSGRYERMLKAMDFYMEENFLFWQTGSLDMALAGQAVPTLPTSAFQVGDVLLSMFGGQGLGTVPGSKGPVGLHLLMMPFDMQGWMPPGLPLCNHESRHQIYNDVKGLESDQQKALRAALIADAKSGAFSLSKDKIRIGKFSAPLLDLIVKMAADTIGEIDADIAGGLLNTGPQFGKAMLLSFPAMLIRSGRVKDAKKLLRTSSVYSLNEQENGDKELEFEPHPPDWIRAHILAAGLDEIGLKKDAQEVRELADDAVGDVPDAITWEDADEKSSVIVSIPVKDIKAVAPTIARTLIRAKLPSLNGLSTGDYAMWNDRRQAKVDLLAKTLLGGKADVPTDKGSIFASYIGAAATKAFWDGVHTDNRDGSQLLDELNDNTFKMLETVQERRKNGGK